MKAVLVGVPLSGKSSVFAAATGIPLDPAAPPEVRQGVVAVPDERLDYLTELCHPKKTTPATVDFVDIPGCALDDAKGKEEWRRILPVVRQADLLVVVVRDFQNVAVPAYRERIDPLADFEAVREEFLFADFDAVTTRVEKLEVALKKPTKTHSQEKREMELLSRCREALEDEKPLSSVLTTDADRRMLSSFAFLTEKPVVCVRNVDDDQASGTDPMDLRHVHESLVMSASLEAEIAQLEPGDRAAFLADFGLDSPARDRLVKACYRAAGLISFLTMGSDEVRAWTVPRGASAVQAAGKIHTDLAHGFIRAETVAYEELVAHTDLKGARANGKVRKEGKTYIVQDGDVMNILASA